MVDWIAVVVVVSFSSRRHHYWRLLKSASSSLLSVVRVPPRVLGVPVAEHLRLLGLLGPELVLSLSKSSVVTKLSPRAHSNSSFRLSCCAVHMSERFAACVSFHIFSVFAALVIVIVG